MLNAALVEQVGVLHRKRASGVLTVVGNGFRLRFCFLDGDPIAMDFGANKGVILARSLLDFHMVSPELHRQLVQACESGQNVTALVRQQQAASEDEIALATKAMVEDTLCRCFGNMHYETVFEENENSSTFDFETTSLRLRIDAQVLLTTVQERVSEIDRLIKSIGGGGAIYALAENESGTPQLNDFEKHLLNFIDGRRTVEDLAQAFRESVINISRRLKGMVDAGVLRRQLGAIARPAEVESASAGVDASGVAASGDLRSIPVRPAGSRLGWRLILTGILAVVSLVGVVKYLGNQRTDVLDKTDGDFAVNLASKHWREADKNINEASEAAGNDILAQRRVETLRSHYRKAVGEEVAAIRRTIAEEEYAAAQGRLDSLPLDDQPTEVRTELIKGQAAFKIAAQARRRKVSQLLERSQVAEALAEIAGAPVGERAAAEEPLDRWRLSSLETASSATVPLHERAALMQLIISSHPDTRQMEQVNRIIGDFARIKQHLKGVIQHLDGRVSKGDYQSAVEEFQSLKLDEQLRGTEIYPQTQALRTKLDLVRGELTGCISDSLAMLREGDDPKAMLHKNDEIQALLARYPAATNASELGAVGAMLVDSAAMIGERTDNDEASVVQSWLADHHPTPIVATTMANRITRLRAVEVASEEALGNGRAFLRDRNWNEAERDFEQLLAHKEWQRTAAHAEAVRELSGIAARRSAQQSWQEELDKAMQSGDISACYRIQEKMGLKYLPVLVTSVPQAQVWKDGAQVGMTPVKLDIPAGERAGLILELRRSGFATSVLHGSQAEAGWLLHCALERQTSLRTDLAMTVTAPLTALDGKLWVADRKHAVSLSLTAKARSIIFEQNGVFDSSVQPLYGAPASCEGVVYFPTREGIALKVLPDRVERISVAGRTDFAMVVFSSQVIVSRRFLILAGKDGSLHATDDGHPETTWTGPAGKAFAAAPFLLGDQVLTVRIDGHIECCAADDGRLVAQYDLASEPLAVWPGHAAICVLTKDALWDCDSKPPRSQTLPQTAASGGEDVFVTFDKHVFLRSDAGIWSDLGRINKAPSAAPRRWGAQAVLPLGKTLLVLGPQGFQAEAATDFLSPTILDGQLAVCTVTGDTRIYPP